jgi:tripartite-type tricarboxylate transporter receptor subunit TctC
MRKLSSLASLFCLCMVLITKVHAQAPYPNKTIRIIAPVAAGGGLDIIARSVAERLSKQTGQNFIVENLTGGGGIIASQTTAKASPDGYTLMIGYVGTHGTNPAVRKLPYDAIKDFTPIGMIGATPNVLVINNDLPAKTVQEFLVFAKKNPSKISYGSAGQGTLTHLAMEQFKMVGDFYSVHIPYRGIAPAFTDLIGGQTQAMFPALFAALPYIKSNRVRALAVTGLNRNPLIPNVPTFKELGLSGFEGQQWYGIVGPAKIPESIVSKLNSELNKVITTPDFIEKFRSEALTSMPMTPNQFGNYITEDIARWAKVAKEKKIEIDQ